MDRLRERQSNMQVITARTATFTATSLCLGLLLFSRSAVFNSLRSHGLQHVLPVFHHLLEFAQTHVP